MRPELTVTGKKHGLICTFAYGMWMYHLPQVPEHLHAVTPVHLLATAGLRLLSAEDAQDILAACTSVLASSRCASNLT